MFMICLHNFFFGACHLLGLNDRVFLEDVKLLLEFEHVPLKEQILESGDSLLSLLAIVLFSEAEKLDEVGVGGDGVFLHQHGQCRDPIRGCTLGQHREVPIAIFRLGE